MWDVSISYGWKVWQGIYFGGTAIWRATYQYFIHQTTAGWCHRYYEITAFTCTKPTARRSSLIVGMRTRTSRLQRVGLLPQIPQFTSAGPTPADANWPGVPACIVQSQSAVALGCFVQRLLSEVPSLRQFTGFILFHAHNLSVPTNESLGDNSKFYISLSFAIIGSLIVFIVTEMTRK